MARAMSAHKMSGSRKAALALVITLALALLSAKTWTHIIVLCVLMGACLIYGLSGWITKKGLSVAERMGRAVALTVFVFGLVAFYGWWFRPGWHLSGEQEDALSEAATKIPKQVVVLVELFENSTAGQAYGHEIMDVLKRKGANVNSITVFRGVDPTPIGLIVCAPSRSDPGYQAAGYMHWKMLMAHVSAKFQEDCPNVDRDSFIIYVGSRPVE